MLYFLQGLGYPLTKIWKVYSNGIPDSSGVESQLESDGMTSSPGALDVDATIGRIEVVSEPIPMSN